MTAGAVDVSGDTRLKGLFGGAPMVSHFAYRQPPWILSAKCWCVVMQALRHGSRPDCTLKKQSMKQASTACHSRVSRGVQNTDSRRFQPVPWRINDFPYQGAGKAIIPVYWLGRCCSGPRSREGLLTDNSAF